MGDQNIYKPVADDYSNAQEERSRRFVADALRAGRQADYVDGDNNRILVQSGGERGFFLRRWVGGVRQVGSESFADSERLFERLNALGCFANPRYWAYSHEYREVSGSVEASLQVWDVDAVRANVSERLRLAGRADYLDPAYNRVLVTRTEDSQYHLQQWIGGYRESNEETYSDVRHVLDRLFILGCLNNIERWTLLVQYHEKPLGQKGRGNTPRYSQGRGKAVVIVVALIAVFAVVAYVANNATDSTGGSTSSVSATHSPPNRSLSSLTAAQWRQLSASDQFNLVEAARKNLTCPVSVSTTVRDVNTVYAAPNVIDKSPSEILPGIALLEGCK